MAAVETVFFDGGAVAVRRETGDERGVEDRPRGVALSICRPQWWGVSEGRRSITSEFYRIISPP